MRRVLFIISVLSVVILILGSCGYQMQQLAQRNREAMPQLKPGMTPKEVVVLMQGEPYNTEFFKGKDGKGVLVYKYITRPTWHGDWNMVTDNDLTPLIFVDNALEGWGWSYLETASTKYEFVIKHKNR